MKKSHIFMLILIAAGVRLAPVLWTGMPYSMDAWSVISNVEVLAENSPISLSSDLFGGYNNFWPGVQIFGTMLSELTSLSPKTSMAIGVPLSSSLAVAVFYAVVERLTEDTKIAFVSALLMAVAFPLVHFRAGVTKETFSVVLFMFLFLLFLKSDDKRALLISVPVSFALVASHHYTSLIALAVLGMASGVIGLKRFLEGNALPKRRLLISALLGCFFAVYYLAFAHGSTFPLPALPHWISAGGFLIVGLALASYLTAERKKILPVLIVIGIYGLAATATQVSLVEGAPVLPARILLYSSFLVLALPIGLIGYWKLQRDGNSTFSLAWIVSISTIILYALFGEFLQSLSVAYRGLYFFAPPLCIFAGAGLLKVYRSNRPLSKPVAVTLLLVLVGGGLSAYYVSLAESGRMLGYQAKNTKGEFEASEWVSEQNFSSIAGDQKTHYLLSHYRGENVELQNGYKYLWGRTEKQPKALYVYDQMYRYGFWLHPYGRELPENWTERTEKMNLMYYNDYVKVFRRAPE